MESFETGGLKNICMFVDHNWILYGRDGTNDDAM
jgi:hypothetical protein